MVDEGERVPIRLVKENGDTISLSATSIDMLVERIQSNLGIPFADAKKMGIDLNQAAVLFEVQGVFGDDTGQEATASATATIDFYQPQQLISWADGDTIGGGGTPGGPGTIGGIGSGFNLGPSLGSGGFSGFNPHGTGGSLGNPPVDRNDLGNRVIKNWHSKYIDLPIAYWVEAAASLDNPVKTGLQLWLKADAHYAVDKWYDNHGLEVTTWSDSSGNGRDASQTTGANKPLFMTSGPGGQPYMKFDGANDYMDVPFDVRLNNEEFTVVVVGSVNDATANTVLSSRTSGPNDKGFELMMISSGIRALWHDDAGAQQTLNSTLSTVTGYAGHIMAYTMKDTDANGQSDEVKVYVEGEHQNTAAVTTFQEVVNTVSLRIGADYNPSLHLDGGISEILIYNRVLTADELHQVEGYLSRKYSIGLATGHPYRGVNYSYEHKHIRVGFDTHRVGSVREPHAYANIVRDTGMTITGFTGGVIDVTGDDPRKWFELTESEGDYRIAFRKPATQILRYDANNIQTGTIISQTSSQITVYYSRTLASITPVIGDEIVILPTTLDNLHASGDTPVIVIPIKNADTYVDTAPPDKSVGPEFPVHEDGSARDTGGGITRTDEYITYLLSNALTGTTDIGKAVNALGETTMNKAFSTVISQSYHNFNSRLLITQLYASSLGQLSDTIETNMGAGQMPVIEGFSGGRSGKKVKSGGDKVQDILGILGNSANFSNIPSGNMIEDILGLGLDFVQNTFYRSEAAQGDFIRGIQIPYNSLVTKGKSNLDTEVAQRNFFLTTEGSTFDKTASANKTHASGLFSHTGLGHYKNGISGLVTDFNVHRDADMKAYEFSLKFIAADIIL